MATAPANENVGVSNCFSFLLLFGTRPATRRHPLMFFECDIIISVNAKNTHDLVDACERRFHEEGSMTFGVSLAQSDKMTGVTYRKMQKL